MSLSGINLKEIIEKIRAHGSLGGSDSWTVERLVSVLAYWSQQYGIDDIELRLPTIKVTLKRAPSGMAEVFSFASDILSLSPSEFGLYGELTIKLWWD